MKTSVIAVRGLLSPLSARGVEQQLAKAPGVKQVEVNCVSGSATVLYDETVTGLDAIKAKVRECGHHCGSELVPKHICEPHSFCCSLFLSWCCYKLVRRRAQEC